MYNILIVDQTIQSGMSLIDSLSLSPVNVIFTDKALQGIKNTKKYDYDLIILGDRTTEGKVYDVALAIRDSRKNKHSAVACVGHNPGKVARLMKLLSPYALEAAGEALEATLGRFKEHFEIKKSQSISEGG